MRNITLEEWDAAVHKVVAAHPDNVNPRRGGTGSCLYFDGKRSCLIGHVLINEFNVSYGRWWEDKGARGVLEDLNLNGTYNFPPEVVWAAQNLQSHADYVEYVEREWGAAPIVGPGPATTWREALTKHDSDDDNPYQH